MVTLEEAYMGLKILIMAQKRRYITIRSKPKTWNYEDGYFFSPNPQLSTSVKLSHRKYQQKRYRHLRYLLDTTPSTVQNTEHFVDWSGSVLEQVKPGLKGRVLPDFVNPRGSPGLPDAGTPSLCIALVFDCLWLLKFDPNLMVYKTNWHYLKQHDMLRHSLGGKIFKRIPSRDVIMGDIVVFGEYANRQYSASHVGIVSKVRRQRLQARRDLEIIDQHVGPMTAYGNTYTRNPHDDMFFLRPKLGTLEARTLEQISLGKLSELDKLKREARQAASAPTGPPFVRRFVLLNRHAFYRCAEIVLEYDRRFPRRLAPAKCFEEPYI